MFLFILFAVVLRFPEVDYFQEENVQYVSSECGVFSPISPLPRQIISTQLWEMMLCETDCFIWNVTLESIAFIGLMYFIVQPLDCKLCTSVSYVVSSKAVMCFPVQLSARVCVQGHVD